MAAPWSALAHHGRTLLHAPRAPQPRLHRRRKHLEPPGRATRLRQNHPHPADKAPPPAKDNVSGGETHTIPGESGSSGEEGRSAGDREPVVKSRPGSHELAGSGTADAPLGSSRKSKTPHETKTAALSDSDGTGSYQPQAGAQYLQVVALGRSEAEGLADVLHKKGFRAHAVPKPGNASLYRVIVGPIRDPGDLSSTRDALRKTGFREVIVQRY